MTPYHGLNGETMQGSGAVLVMIWTPILTLVLYPLAARLGWRPTALRRMAAGMVLGALAFVVSGVIQARMDGGQTVSILWQLAPYVVLEAGEVLLSATGLEFAFEQAPPRLKSVVMSMWLMTIAAGHFLIAVFTSINENFIKARGAAQIYVTRECCSWWREYLCSAPAGFAGGNRCAWRAPEAFGENSFTPIGGGLYADRHPGDVIRRSIWANKLLKWWWNRPRWSCRTPKL